MPRGPASTLLLHGFTHTGASWERVVAALSGRHRWLTPDIRGHGASSERQPVNLTAVVADLSGLMPERSTVVGYSMGGRLALHLALAEPARIERLVLIGASPGLASRSERQARRRADDQLAEWMERSTIEEVAARWARTPILAGLPAAVAERAQEDRLRSTPGGLARALRGLGTGVLPSVWERLEELTMPVTLVAGERDDKFRAIAREMAASIRQCDVAIVPETGHAVHLEAPGRVAEIISAAPPAGPR